jgi:hypothetical protein
MTNTWKWVDRETSYKTISGALSEYTVEVIENLKSSFITIEALERVIGHTVAQMRNMTNPLPSSTSNDSCADDDIGADQQLAYSFKADNARAPSPLDSQMETEGSKMDSLNTDNISADDFQYQKGIDIEKFKYLSVLSQADMGVVYLAEIPNNLHTSNLIFSPESDVIKAMNQNISVQGSISSIGSMNAGIMKTGFFSGFNSFRLMGSSKANAICHSSSSSHGGDVTLPSSKYAVKVFSKSLVKQKWQVFSVFLQ